MNQEDLNNELVRLDRTDLSTEVKDKIKEFVSDIHLAGLCVSMGLSSLISMPYALRMALS